jgi:hypothetical protein
MWYPLGARVGGPLPIVAVAARAWWIIRACSALRSCSFGVMSSANTGIGDADTAGPALCGCVPVTAPVGRPVDGDRYPAGCCPVGWNSPRFALGEGDGVEWRRAGRVPPSHPSIVASRTQLLRAPSLTRGDRRGDCEEGHSGSGAAGATRLLLVLITMPSHGTGMRGP